MAGWLDKIKASTLPVPPKAPLKANLPAKQPPQAVAKTAPLTEVSTLPTASVIYGVAASGLFVIAVYFLLTGRWFTGALVLLPSVCFLGFALQFLKIK